jgi:valyl-tRNA synthetase
VDWKNAKALSDVALIQEVVTALRTIRAELKLDPKKKVQAEFSAGDAVARDLIEANQAAIERFAALSGLRVTSERLQGDGMTRSTSAFDLRIPFTKIVNPQVEIARLRKEIEGLQKAIASKERQLGDETFRSRAPEKIIKGLETTLAEQRIELQKLQERLAQLEKGS